MPRANGKSLRRANRFLEPAANPVAQNRFADLLGDGEAKSRRWRWRPQIDSVDAALLKAELSRRLQGKAPCVKALALGRA
ncbi:hypothetical protein SIN04_04860 [Methylocella tundrae]|nr:hypothetical protein [Methylocella tundrae]WPP05160.1 hypothetical protein SIN04_04860 [Methylocella tundrae]